MWLYKHQYKRLPKRPIAQSPERHSHKYLGPDQLSPPYKNSSMKRDSQELNSKETWQACRESRQEWRKRWKRYSRNEVNDEWWRWMTDLERRVQLQKELTIEWIELRWDLRAVPGGSVDCCSSLRLERGRLSMSRLCSHPSCRRDSHLASGLPVHHDLRS